MRVARTAPTKPLPMGAKERPFQDVMLYIGRSPAEENWPAITIRWLAVSAGARGRSRGSSLEHTPTGAGAEVEARTFDDGGDGGVVALGDAGGEGLPSRRAEPGDVADRDGGTGVELASNKDAAR